MPCRGKRGKNSKGEKLACSFVSGLNFIMGSKKSHPPSDFEFDMLAKQTGLDQFTLKGLYSEFSSNSKNGLMNKKQFQRLYSTLTPGEDPASSFKLKRIANRVFKAFDHDKSGSLTFDEFVAAYYMLKTQGQARQKMEFLLQQIAPNMSEGQPATISKRQTLHILNGMDAGFGVSRSSEAIKTLEARESSANPESYSVASLINTVVNDPVYKIGFDTTNATTIMNNSENDEVEDL